MTLSRKQVKSYIKREPCIKAFGRYTKEAPSPLLDEALSAVQMSRAQALLSVVEALSPQGTLRCEIQNGTTGECVKSRGDNVDPK